MGEKAAGVSRRSFLKGASGLALAVMGSTATGCASGGKDVSSKTGSKVSDESNPSRETLHAFDSDSTIWAMDEIGEPAEKRQAELVIIGGGGAGMAAAIQAKQLGLEPVVLEKADALGGSFSGCEGLFAVGSHWQKEQGFDYSTNDFVEDCLVYHHYSIQEDLLRNYFNRSGETIQWLEDLGVEFDFITSSAGSRTAWHVPKGSPKPGPYMCGQLVAATENAGIDVQLGTEAKKIVTDDNGAVCGVIAQCSDGSLVEYETKAALLCSGGYADNADMIKYFAGVDPDSWMSYGVPGHNGDGLKMAHAIGAGLCRAPGTMVINGPGVEGIAFGTPMAAVIGQPYQVLVNSNAERYVREDLSATNFCMAGQAMMTQPGPVYMFFNEAQLNDLEHGKGAVWGNGVFAAAGQPIEGVTDQLNGLLDSVVYKADTINDLAETFGLDSAQLNKTFDRYNELCDKGEDVDFMKPAEYLWSFVDGPYYGMKCKNSLFFTVGGLHINTDNSVLDVNGTPIVGLYASGCDAGGLYGECYDYNITPGSQGAWSINSGRMAAESIAEFLK